MEQWWLQFGVHVPAMILLDLLTTERYGFGTHITDSNLDLFSFVAAE